MKKREKIYAIVSVGLICLNFNSLFMNLTVRFNENSNRIEINEGDKIDIRPRNINDSLSI